MRAQNFLRRTSLERKFRENLLFHGSLSYVDIVIVIALELARTVTFKHRLKARLQLKKKKKKAMRSKRVYRNAHESLRCHSVLYNGVS